MLWLLLLIFSIYSTKSETNNGGGIVLLQSDTASNTLQTESSNLISNNGGDVGVPADLADKGPAEVDGGGKDIEGPPDAAPGELGGTSSNVVGASTGAGDVDGPADGNGDAPIGTAGGAAAALGDGASSQLLPGVTLDTTGGQQGLSDDNRVAIWHRTDANGDPMFIPCPPKNECSPRSCEYLAQEWADILADGDFDPSHLGPTGSQVCFSEALTKTELDHEENPGTCKYHNVDAARELCRRYGMRLCTACEVAHGEAGEGGGNICGIQAPFWTGTKCHETRNNEGYLTGEWDSGTAEWRLNCKARGNARVRCCADTIASCDGSCSLAADCANGDGGDECTVGNAISDFDSENQGDYDWICGDDDPDGDCDPGTSGQVTYDEAVQFCADAGWRVCSALELENGETESTGCNRDSERYWSSDRCAYIDDLNIYVHIGRVTTLLSSSDDRECTDVSTSTDAATSAPLYVKCCADEASITCDDPERDDCRTTPVSSRSCEELDIDPEIDGDPDVCSEESGSCLSLGVTYDQFIDHCYYIGMRPCNLQEMISGEDGTCGYSEELWTGTQCGIESVFTLDTSDGSTDCREYCDDEEEGCLSLRGYCCADTEIRLGGAGDCKTCSSKDCHELGIRGRTGNGKGNPFVCADSRIDTNGTRITKTDYYNWYDSKLICEWSGMRMCTLREINGKQTKGTGEGKNDVAQWSTEPCDAGGGTPGHYTNSGRANIPACTPDDDESSVTVTCCADSRDSPVCCGEENGYQYGKRPGEAHLCSQNTCPELDWKRNGTVIIQADPAVTYESFDVCTIELSNDECPPNDMTHGEAHSFCNCDLGMRLCSVNEVLNHEVADAGCGLNDDLIWTDTPCGVDSFYVTWGKWDGRLDDLSMSDTPANVMCKHKDEETDIRTHCCADMDSSAPCGCSGTSECVPECHQCSPRSCDESDDITAIQAQHDQGDDAVCGLKLLAELCPDPMSWEDAEKTCRCEFGGRLCTEFEVLERETNSLGCGLSQTDIWTRTKCTFNNKQGYVVHRGNAEYNDPTDCAGPDEVLPFRCCGDVDLSSDRCCDPSECRECSAVNCDSDNLLHQHRRYKPDYGNICGTAMSKRDGSGVRFCAEDVYPDSVGKLITWQNATEFCYDSGFRLCTIDELEGTGSTGRRGATRGTGCNLDNQRLWSSTPCPGGVLTSEKGKDSDPAGRECHPRDTRVAGGRCCIDEDINSGDCCIGSACHTPMPTSTPTVLPTPTTTAEPTADPTAEPTADPTADPTGEPTADPTGEPTADPTAEPTADPTARPTGMPSASPTGRPTARPTQMPTMDPTNVPTGLPTLHPTPQPTAGAGGTAMSDALTGAGSGGGNAGANVGTDNAGGAVVTPDTLSGGAPAGSGGNGGGTGGGNGGGTGGGGDAGEADKNNGGATVGGAGNAAPPPDKGSGGATVGGTGDAAAPPPDNGSGGATVGGGKDAEGDKGERLPNAQNGGDELQKPSESQRVPGGGKVLSSNTNAGQIIM